MKRIASQVEEIALDFGRRFSDQPPSPAIDCPKHLREMVVSATIGSGIRYEIALSMAKSLVENPTTEEIERVSAKHRFPNQTRVRLLALFSKHSGMLDETVEWLNKPTCVFKNRRLMANLVPGLGPKQSSFLFSCTGYGNEIAVLDRHILKYLQIVGITDVLGSPVSWKKYEYLEAVFLRYSANKNIRADALDLAIWITMKAAGKEATKCAQ